MSIIVSIREGKTKFLIVFMKRINIQRSSIMVALMSLNVHHTNSTFARLRSAKVAF